VARVPQGGGGVSVLGDVNKLSGHNPRQPVVGDPAGAGELDQVASRALFQLYDSVIQTPPSMT